MATLTEARRPRSARLRTPLLLGAGVAAATLALHVRDPHVSGSWGLCPLKFVTGLECPGCGGLRAVNDLTNLEFVSAVSSNLLVVLAIPVAVLLWFRWVRDAWTGAAPDGRPATIPTYAVVGILVVMAVFVVVRNLPAGAWLAP